MRDVHNYVKKLAQRRPTVRICIHALLALCIFFGGDIGAADKPEAWIEVRSPHFRVVSNGNEKQARRVAGQFERFREVLRNTLTKGRLDPATPLLIFAVKDEKSLKTLLPEFWEKKVNYNAVAGMPYAGEILNIEVRQ